MPELNTEQWMAILFAIVFFSWSAAILLFGRISLKYLNTEMAKEGITPPEWDKGIGSIMVTYALVIIYPKLKPTIVDYEAIRRHARKKDHRLAVFMHYSAIALFTVGGIVYYLYGPSD